jgi:RND family efflux transporter MFP subunit
MIRYSASPLLELIRSAGVREGVGDLPDHELLARISRGRDEAAFLALLRRHGRMVLDVCRGVLGNEADAEDAFQATFLILVRKVSAILKHASVGSWLHGVAYRTSLKARGADYTRRKHEARAERPISTADDPGWREVQEVLHAELSRCSYCYQAPLVLCYLEGKTQEEAAALLGVSRTTVKKRLERGRALLRARLMRRGLTSAVVLALSAWPGSASACLPPELETATVNAVIASMTGSVAATGVISARVATLTNGVLKTMWMTRCGLTAAVVFVGLLATGLGGLAYQRLAAGTSEDRKEAQQAGKTQPEDEQVKHARFNLDIAEANLKQAEAAVQVARDALERAKARAKAADEKPQDVARVADVVTVRARVSGFVEKIHFNSGAIVKRGELLLEIDARPFKAEQAKADADLAQAQARLQKLEDDLEKLKRLATEEAIAGGALKKHQLEVADTRNSLRLAQKQCEQARLQIEWTRVTAPVDGKISKPFVEVGNLVTADDTVIAQIVPAGRDIKVSQPIVREVADHEDYTGRVEAVQSVEIAPRISGALEKINFKPGAIIKRGDVLFEIDSLSVRAEVEKAEAEISRADAKLKLTTAEYERLKDLVTRGAASREDLVSSDVNRSDAEAVRQAARANLTAARVKLDLTRITAPIDGKISRPTVTAGNIVRADSTILATIHSTGSVLVSFDVDERTLLRLVRLRREGKIKVENEMDLPVEMGLADEDGYPRRGKVESVDVKVDPTTGTVRWRAVFPNTDGLLIPGMFARVRLTTRAPQRRLLVAEQALQSDRGQRYLLVVTEKNVVEQRTVKLGPAHDGLRVVLEGLTAGELVIVKGLGEVRPGMTVQPEKVAMPVRRGN